MSVFKNESDGTWYVMARYVDRKGERRQKCKRGFETKREAQEWERNFQQQNASKLDMTLEDFIPKDFWKYYDLFRRKKITMDQYVEKTGLRELEIRNFLKQVGENTSEIIEKPKQI